MKTGTALAAALIAASLLPGAAAAGPKGCPPGLAKKSPACVPPGQAKNFSRYRVGDRIDGDYRYIRDYDRYRLDRGDYVVAGDYVYRIDPGTRKVLNLVGAVADLLN